MVISQWFFLIAHSIWNIYFASGTKVIFISLINKIMNTYKLLFKNENLILHLILYLTLISRFMMIKISCHEYYECLSRHNWPKNPLSDANILSSTFRDTFLVVLAVFILSLYASRYTQNAQRHKHRHSGIIFQGKENRRGQTRGTSPPLQYKFSQVQCIFTSE